jgi:hypothetical protein
MSVAAQTITRTDLRVYAFTRDKVLKGTRDHVFNHDPLTAMFLGKDLGSFGGVKMRGLGKSNQVGGASVMIRVRLGKHSGSKFMAGPWDTHSVTPDDNVRLAEANWIHASGALVVTDTDKGINRGDEAMASFIADQTESVMLSLVDTIGVSLQTATPGANAPTPLDYLINDTDIATLQGLTTANYAKYNSRGISKRGTAPGSVTYGSGSFAQQGIPNMRTCYNNASEGTFQPNAIVCTYLVHEYYEGALQPLERFVGAVNTADASFESLAFRKTPVMASPNTPDGYMWMLRIGDDGVQVKMLDGFDFHFAPFKDGSNQETHVSELQWKGQLIIQNRQYGSNKLTGISA